LRSAAYGTARQTVQALKIETESQMEMVDVTAGIRRAIKEAGVTRGMCHLFVPHTTAAITINENTDSRGRRDMLAELIKTVPAPNGGSNGESAVPQVLSSLVGTSKSVLIDEGRLVLGTWQAIYLCEFDGPRARNLLLRVTAD
jgi:secondary thiamine-phosphate synthase enzyme